MHVNPDSLHCFVIQFMYGSTSKALNSISNNQLFIFKYKKPILALSFYQLDIFEILIDEQIKNNIQCGILQNAIIMIVSYEIFI